MQKTCEFIIPCTNPVSDYCGHNAFCELHDNCRGQSKWAIEQNTEKEKKHYESLRK